MFFTLTLGDSYFPFLAYSYFPITTENQRLEIERAGFMVDYFFADEGVSGSSHASQRPQFRALLGQIRNGETLIVSKLDRLGRGAQDVLSTMKTLAEREIKVFVIQLGQLDLTSPAGKLMLTMLAAVAEMERDLLVERTQAGLARAKQQCKTLGRPHKTTEQQRSQIIEMSKSGQSVSALSRNFGISRASILRITVDQGIQQ